MSSDHTERAHDTTRDADWKAPPLDIAALLAREAALREDLRSCRGTVKTELNHYERLAVVHGKTPHGAAYEAEAQRLHGLLERIDALPIAAPAEAPALECGHPTSLLLRSAETGEPLYCELCDYIIRAHDAEKMEAELRATLAAAPTEAPAPDTHVAHSNQALVLVNRTAVEWLKRHKPALCEKAGLKVTEAPAPKDTRKPCTCDGAGRGPGRECVVKAGGRLGELWRCAKGVESAEAPADQREQSLAMMLRMCASALKRRDLRVILDDTPTEHEYVPRESAKAPAPAPTEPPIPPKATLERHVLQAGECPPSSLVVLWSSIQRLQARAHSEEVVTEAPAPAEAVPVASEDAVAAGKFFLENPSAALLAWHWWMSRDEQRIKNAAALASARESGRREGREEAEKVGGAEFDDGSTFTLTGWAGGAAPGGQFSTVMCEHKDAAGRVTVMRYVRQDADAIRALP